MKRKLTTILCADGVGFSGHMAVDEDRTLERLHRYRSVMGELFSRHDGREVNTWGDAVIAEFASVVEAVRCAVEIQEAIASENASHPATERMQFRIGVNLGDVMVDGDDLYGDGVNVAARLQELAEPGGVAVSGTVHDLTHKQLAVGFDFIGERKVKNLPDPVPTYAVRMERRNAPAPGAESLDDDEQVFTRTGNKLDALRAWIRAQPRGVQRAVGFIVFFFAANALFSGLASPWFIFPSAPFALYIFRHIRRQRRLAGEG